MIFWIVVNNFGLEKRSIFGNNMFGLEWGGVWWLDFFFYIGVGRV